MLSYEILDTDNLMYDLIKEFEYYKYFSYDTKNEAVDITYCNRDEWYEPDNEEPSTIQF